MKSSLGRRIHSRKIVSNLGWSVFRSLLKLDFSSNVRLPTKNSNYTHPLAFTLGPTSPPPPRQVPPTETKGIYKHAVPSPATSGTPPILHRTHTRKGYCTCQDHYVVVRNG